MTSVSETMEGAAPHADGFLTSGPHNRSYSASCHNVVALTATKASETPRTLTGKRPTAAALQREHEYMDWLATLPPPERDDDDCYDDSPAAFMATRRQRSERERSKQRAQQRREQRHARGLQRKPAGQGPRYGGPIDPAIRVVGRPINPNSKRQQLLAARAQRKVERAETQQRQKAEWKQHRRETREHAAQLDLNVGSNGARAAKLWLDRRNSWLEHELANFDYEHRHAAEYHFWRGCAEAAKDRLRGSASGWRCWHSACEKWYAAKAEVAAAAAATSSVAAVEAHAALAYAVALAARAAAEVAHSRRAGRFALELLELDQPWVVAAFQAAGVDIPSDSALASPPPPPQPAPAVPPKLPMPTEESTFVRPRDFRDDAAAESLALAEQARRRCLAEWESDERIDREHSPPRLSHVCAADRDRDCAMCGEMTRFCRCRTRTPRSDASGGGSSESGEDDDN